MAHQFAAWQLAHIDLLPVRQGLACAALVAQVQRVANAREMVAELAKTERDVEHGNVPHDRQRPAHKDHQQHMDAPYQACRQDHR